MDPPATDEVTTMRFSVCLCLAAATMTFRVPFTAGSISCSRGENQGTAGQISRLLEMSVQQGSSLPMALFIISPAANKQ